MELPGNDTSLLQQGETPALRRPTGDVDSDTDVVGDRLEGAHLPLLQLPVGRNLGQQHTVLLLLIPDGGGYDAQRLAALARELHGMSIV